MAVTSREAIFIVAAQLKSAQAILMHFNFNLKIQILLFINYSYNFFLFFRYVGYFVGFELKYLRYLCSVNKIFLGTWLCQSNNMAVALEQHKARHFSVIIIKYI